MSLLHLIGVNKGIYITQTTMNSIKMGIRLFSSTHFNSMDSLSENKLTTHKDFHDIPRRENMSTDDYR